MKPCYNAPMSPIFALPTLLTLGNLLCGFFAIVAISDRGSTENLAVAALLILLAMLLDGFDGVTARRLGVVSQFGMQLDNLADMVSFGVAPAMLLIALCGESTPALWAVAAWMVCATALRLARFTATADASDGPRAFTGLPCPAAAATLASVAIAIRSVQSDLPAEIYAAVLRSTPLLLPGAAIAMGALMVSTVRYPHPADWLANRPIGFQQATLLALAAASLLACGGYAPLLICVLFVLSPLARMVFMLPHHQGRGVR